MTTTGRKSRRGRADKRGPGPPTRPYDVAIETLAAAQKGVATRDQLVRAGVPAHIIEYALKSGRFKLLYRGVYQVGPVLAAWGRELAAVLACGAGALLSHRSAAVFWAMLPPDPDDDVDVSMTGALRGRQPGIRAHRAGAGMSRWDRTVREGIPVTTPARTLLDLAATASSGDLRRAFDNAEQARLVTVAAVRKLIARHPGRRGVARLAALLPDAGHHHLTRSQLERTFLRLLRRYGLPAPRTNVRVGGVLVDCYWADLRLIAELDGHRVHGARRAFEADRSRDLALAAAGLHVLRITWRQLETSPQITMVRVAQAMAVRVGG
jgi:very-short-patch-repair endonuclease